MNSLCSVFFYEGYVGVSPTIINLSKVLEQQGYSVNIYGTKNNYPAPGKLGDRIQIIHFTKGERLFQKLKQYGLKDLVPLLELIFYIVPCLLTRLKNRNKFAQASVNIGVDIYGAITALIFFLLFKQEFLFLSLELHEPSRFKGLSKLVGILAKLAYRKSAGLIIQDEDRFKTFCQYYEYQNPIVYYLPNSTIATNNPSLDLNSENYFRQKFNLSKELFPHIILQAGMICDAVYSKTLAQAFKEVDCGCALIFHDRQLRKEDSYIQSLRQINSQNLFLSLEPVPYEEIEKIFSTATIGLAFYADLGNNFAQISMASGKLPQYLKHGTPVLVSDLPSLSQLVERYKFGIAIKDPSDSEEIKAAINEILNNYNSYSNNAKYCFEAEFDFEKKMAPILAFIDDLKV